MTVHTHCWHLTNTMLCSMPPQRVEVCCVCGEKRNLVIRSLEDNPEGHRQFHPNALRKAQKND